MRARLSIMLLALAVVMGATLAPSWAGSGAKKTTITFSVQGCEGCTVQPVQTDKNYNATYRGPKTSVTGSQVVMTVPTKRTKNMSFLVYAPWVQGEFADYPMVPAIRYRPLKVRQIVTSAFAGAPHRASACWSGTSRRSMRNVLVVRQVESHGQLLAAGYLQRTMKTKRNFTKVSSAGIHLSEATQCT